MIVVTRLNGSQFAVNPDLIERIHANPDTTLVMVDGAKYIVTESMTEVIDMIAAFRAHIIRLARDVPPTVHQHGHQPLGLVPPPQSGVETGEAGKTVPLRPRNE